MTRIELPREMKIRHLTLHRKPRAISSREFNALSQDERLELLQAASGRRKYDLLIEAADAQQLLQQLPAQEVYLLARELGAEDVPELVTLASPEQITTMIDLDCWKDDQFDPKAALSWLSLLLEAGDEHIIETLAGMEIELLTFIFQQWVTVVSGPEELDDDARAEAMNRNGGYAIEYNDSEAAKPIGRLLEILLNHDRELFRQLVEGTRQELPAQLQEDLYRWRSGRLQDLGFSDPVDAKSIYSWLDPESFRVADHLREGAAYAAQAVQPPGYLLVEISPRPLLAEVLANGLDQNAAWELTFLLNKLMAADRVDPGDREQLTRTLDRLYSSLNLALEFLAGQDAEQAVEVFATVYFEYLFRLGFSLTLQLQRRARKLMASPLGPYLDAPLRPAVELLCQARPEFYLPLEGGSRAGSRQFSSVQDLELLRDLLTRLELQLQLVTRHFPTLLPDPEQFGLSGCEPGTLAELELSDLFLTALANQILGRPFAPEPIPRAELLPLQQQVTTAGALNPDLRSQTRQWLESLEPGGGRLADWCLDIWEEEFCPLAPEELNPRYISGLIIRL
jgi:Family of unknown function (DUF6178)